MLSFSAPLRLNPLFVPTGLFKPDKEVTAMKRFISFVVMLVMLTAMASFAGEHGKKMSVDEKISWMSKELNLTADQQAKLKPILESQQQQIETVWKDSSLTDEAKMAKKTEIKSSTSTQINALLNAEQQAKYATLQQQSKPTTAAKNQ
jgi:Spy/CpxP family protein refolding chaperone